MSDEQYPNGWDKTSEDLWRKTNEARVAAGHKPQTRHEMAGLSDPNVISFNDSAPVIGAKAQRLLDVAAQLYGEHVVSTDNIGYLYTLHASCYLPRRRTDADSYTHRVGAYSLHLERGSLENPNTGEYEKQPLPYGGKPRALQFFIDTSIKRNQSPVINLGNSFSDFVELMSGSATGGVKGSIRTWKQQLSSVAATNMTFGVNFNGQKARNKKLTMADEIEVWFSKDKSQKSLFTSELIVTDKYYENVMKHSMPADVRAVKVLQSSPMATDIYRWLINRLPKAKKGGEFLVWDILWRQFGADYKQLKHFKPEFRNGMLMASAVYPKARISEEGNGFKFYRSEPVISKSNTKLITTPEY